MLLFSCVTSKGVIHEFTYCFDGKVTGLDTLINTNGYYLNYKVRDYIFYNYGFTKTANFEHWKEQVPTESSKYGIYGVYNVFNDTIKVQYITPPNGKTQGKYDVWFKVIDKNTIQMIYYGGRKRYISNVDVEDFKTNSYYSLNDMVVFKFHPLKALPDIKETFVYDKKWFWCNEDVYNKRE